MTRSIDYRSAMTLRPVIICRSLHQDLHTWDIGPRDWQAWKRSTLQRVEATLDPDWQWELVTSEEQERWDCITELEVTLQRAGVLPGLAERWSAEMRKTENLITHAEWCCKGFGAYYTEAECPFQWVMVVAVSRWWGNEKEMNHAGE